MDVLYVVIIAFLMALIAWLLTHFIMRARYTGRLAAKDIQLSESQASLAAKEAELEAEKRLDAERALFYDKRIAELKQANEAALKQQVEALKVSVTAESEKVLKSREEELNRRAEKTFSDITENLGKDLKGLFK